MKNIVVVVLPVNRRKKPFEVLRVNRVEITSKDKTELMRRGVLEMGEVVVGGVVVVLELLIEGNVRLEEETISEISFIA